MRFSRLAFLTFAAAVCATLALPAAAQPTPRARYNINVPTTCDVGGATTRCSPAQPVVNPDGSTIGTAAQMATGQVDVTTSATLIVPARVGRRSLNVTSMAAVVFYVGGATVSATTGQYVAAVAGASIPIPTEAAVYAIGASNVRVSYMETF